MLIKCPRCFTIISTVSPQFHSESNWICQCGQDLSEFDERSQTSGQRIAAGLRVAVRNGVIGAVLGTLFSALVMTRIARAAGLERGTAGMLLMMAVGPATGFLLAVVLGDRFLFWIEELLK